MQIIVQKFGGTSVADLYRIKHVSEIIKQEINSGNKVVAVVSAMSGVTNSLIAKCLELSRIDSTSSLREYDAAIATGEVVTSALLAMQLQTIGIEAKSLQAWQIPITTNDTHSNSQITKINAKKIQKLLAQGITPVITGFQGVSTTGNVSTLGKGGSDTTAAALAACLKAARCDIYTDVNGIYTADPRVVKNAQKIDEIDIDQLYELCSAGAKVLHPRAALAAKRYGFSLRILSSFEPCIGTTAKKNSKNMENRKITAITSNKNLLKITLAISQGRCNLISVIDAFAKELVPIEQINNFSDDSCIIIANLADKNKCTKLLWELKTDSLINNYSIDANISSVTLIGYGIKNDVNFISQASALIHQNLIKLFSLDISDIKLSLIIEDKDNEKAIKLLYDYCFSNITL